jgi:hypothetical protein
MSSKLPHIAAPNHIAITGMSDDDLIQSREYYIMCIVQARRYGDSDTLNAALGWLDSLVSEMRLRGTRGTSDNFDSDKAAKISDTHNRVPDELTLALEKSL